MASSSLRVHKLGLIVNPIAGLGGAVGLKGTDRVVERALQLGAKPEAEARAGRALQALMHAARGGRAVADGELPQCYVLTAEGSMGEDVARAAGLDPEVIATAAGASSQRRAQTQWRDRSNDEIPVCLSTCAGDTQHAARMMLDREVDLLLFAGGDGTARDIFEVVGDKIPILGVPAGVKMHSAVFATSATRAGEVAWRFLAGERSVVVERAEVMDRDEVLDRDETRSQRVSPNLYGFALTLRAPLLMQHAKSSPRSSDTADLQGACECVADAVRGGGLTVIGPGTTTQMVKRVLGFEGTLDGVDVVANGRLLALDQTESQILAAVRADNAAHGSTVRIVVSVVGGQGSLFGRGNQQISAEVIRRAGRDNVVVVASRSKLLSLPDQCLFVDTGVADADALLSGYLPVWVGPREKMIYRVQGGTTCAPGS